MNAIARTAQRLDAEYDGGHSDVGDDSADSEDSPLKLQTANSRKIKLAAKVGKRGKEEELLPKRQKTGRSSSHKHKGGSAEKEEKKAADGKLKEKHMEDKSEDSVDEEIRRLTVNLATKRKHVASADESQRTISALLEQTRKTQRSLMYAATSYGADVSACDETQAEDEVGKRGGPAVGEPATKPSDVDGDADMPPAQAQADSKCIVGIKRNGDAKTKKFKIFMQDQMCKVMDAYIASRQLDSSKVRFIFDGLPISRDQTPKDLDMEPGEENLVEIV